MGESDNDCAIRTISTCFRLAVDLWPIRFRRAIVTRPETASVRSLFNRNRLALFHIKDRVDRKRQRDMRIQHQSKCVMFPCVSEHKLL